MKQKTIGGAPRWLAAPAAMVLLSVALLVSLIACGYVDRHDARAAMNSVRNAGAEFAARDETALHVLGDSFAGAPGLQSALRRQLANRSITFDFVGGSSLTEQAARFEATPDKWYEPLVILDGGLTDIQPLQGVDRIVSRLEGPCPTWFYVEPVQTAAGRNVPGNPRFERQRRNVAAVRAKYPDHFIAVIGPLQRHALADDRIDVRKGWVPASLRFDRVHLNDRGYAILAAQIANHIRKAERNGSC